jgi:hypothetical protein
MNRLWLKMVGRVVVASVAITAVYVFWPPETTQVAESKDTKQLEKAGELKLGTWTERLRPAAKPSAG